MLSVLNVIVVIVYCFQFILVLVLMLVMWYSVCLSGLNMCMMCELLFIIVFRQCVIGMVVVSSMMMNSSVCNRLFVFI